MSKAGTIDGDELLKYCANLRKLLANIERYVGSPISRVLQDSIQHLANKSCLTY